MDVALVEAKRRFNEMLKKAQSPYARWLNTIETDIEKDSRQMNHDLLQGSINSMGTGDIGPVLYAADGAELTHRRPLETILYTIHGKITIKRLGYSQRGHESIFPLDAAINLPPSAYSFELQRFIARRITTVSFDEVLDLVHEVTGIKIGRRQALEVVLACAVDFDDFYAKPKVKPKGRPAVGSAEAPIMVLTTDGKGIVMRPEGLREGTRKRAEAAKRKMEKRLAKGEKTNRKRMAQIASLYLTPRFERTPTDILKELARENAEKRRPKPIEKRVWASVEKEADDVIRMLFIEAHKRDPKHKKEWVVLVDGHQDQMRQVKKFIRREGVSAVIILDLIHVIEYLWNAARVFYPGEAETSTQCQQWVSDKLEMVLNSEAGKVAGSIRISAAKNELTEAQRKTATKCAAYIAKRKAYMNYSDYLKKGCPIATGVIEGACRFMVRDRMEVTGARWSLDGAESVLKLRALVINGDFDAYWEYHIQCEHRRNHMSKLRNPEQLETLFTHVEPS